MSRFASTGARALVVVLAAVASVAALTVSAQDEPKPAAGEFESSLPEPTEAHKVLRQEVGVWEAEITTWLAGPEQEPDVSRGVERNRMMPGGLWLISDFEAEMGGAPYHGHGHTGYDTKKQKYVGSWVDSMSTALTNLEGERDPATGAIVMEGESLDPVSGQPYRVRLVSTSDGRNSRSMTMFMGAPGGDEMIRAMEIRYTRRDGGEPKKKPGEPKKKPGEPKKKPGEPKKKPGEPDA
jgi:hypothetical protein